MVYAARFQTPMENPVGLTLLGMILSSLLHAALVVIIHYGLVLNKPAPPIVAELDLSMSSLVPIVPVQARPEPKPIPKVRRSAPPKQVAIVPVSQSTPMQEAPETKEEVMREENRETQPCSDCTESPTDETDETDDSDAPMENEGQYIPVENVFKKPRWIRNFITARDYPYVARQQGKDGRVVLIILIDLEGRVRDARLLQGGYDVLNEVALRKIREAIFAPAYDADNRPVPSRVILPIRFELR